MRNAIVTVSPSSVCVRRCAGPIEPISTGPSQRQLRVGEQVHIRGHTTDFGQTVESLQVNHAPVTEVGSLDDFGMKVRQHAREHDVVYKVK